MDFRARLLATLRAIRPVISVPGVLVVGSEVPNLLEQRAAATLVVSRDVDVGVPVESHAEVVARLAEVVDLRASPDEPSVWLPRSPGLLEVNFVGMDTSIRHASESYVLEDSVLPLMVFGHLSLMQPADPIEIDGLRIPVPRTADLLLEKLITDRSGEKGDRDRLVVLGLLLTADASDLDQLEAGYRALPDDLRHAVRANLGILSLLQRRAGMPDPTTHRPRVAHLLRRLEAGSDEP